MTRKDTNTIMSTTDNHCAPPHQAYLCTPIPATVPLGPGPYCTEDMPCWDCHTMGDQQCGPTITVTPPHGSHPISGIEAAPIAGAGLGLVILGTAIVRSVRTRTMTRKA